MKKYSDFYEYAVGKCFDTEGRVSEPLINWYYPYQGQCVSLVKAYLKFLGYGVLNFGNAIDWWKYRDINGIKNYCDIVTNPKEGDICVTEGSDARYGHIVVLHDSNNVLTQNCCNNPKATVYSKVYQGKVLGYLRPKCLDGWSKNNIGWWYRINGACIKNDWKKIKEYWYYFDSHGYMKTGWIKWSNNEEEENWYYLDKNGRMYSNKWVLYKDKWYFLKEKGQMAHNEWIDYKDKKYYLDSHGHMLVGHHDIDGECYEFDEKGALLCSR